MTLTWTHSALKPPARGQELLGHIKREWQIKMMAVFFFTAHEKGFKFHAQPATPNWRLFLLNITDTLGQTGPLSI